MSRFGVVSCGGLVLQSEQGEGTEAGAVPAEVAACSGVVGVAGAVEDAGDGVACDTMSHVVSELVEEVWLMPAT